jgi:adenylate cyclase
MARVVKPDLKPPADYIYIDYNANPAPFPELSFAEVYQKAREGDKDYLAGHFKDKLVFIGETDTISDDRHATPLYYLSDAGLKRTAGIRILAHTVSTLLGERFFRETPELWRLALFLLLAFLTSTLTVYGPARLIPALPFLLVSAWMATGMTAYINYILIPAASGLLTVLLAWGVSFAYRYFIVDREKRKTKAVFTRYLPAPVVDRVLASRDDDFFLGESRRLCLMFTDIRSFTTYSEKKDPVEVVRRLNEYFEAMSMVIISENGIVDKFLGDGIMAFFGAFDDRPPSLSGARAALKMMDELEKLNQKWAAAGEETFRIGIGIHTGPVKVGNIGSHRKMEYTVIGDAVNLASRLQDKTKALGEEIIISHEVYQDLGDMAEVVDKGFTDIKGRSESRVYGLKGLRD